ncbi:hypothetical protein ACNJYG_08750 [Pseudomonas sp. GW6]
MNNSSAHLLAQHGELLQVGAVVTGQPLQEKSGRFLKALAAAAICISLAAGYGHHTQGVREEAARVAAAEKAEAARLAEEQRIAAIQVAGLQQRLLRLQDHISTQRDQLLERFAPLIADRETDPDIEQLLERYPAPIKSLQAIDPLAFEAFIELDRDSWIASRTSPKLDQHYQAENATIQEGKNYLDKINRELKAIDQRKAANASKTEIRELKAHGSPAKPEAFRLAPVPPVAPEPVMPLETPAVSAPAAAPAPAPAAKPRTAPTGVPGKVQVLDW